MKKYLWSYVLFQKDQLSIKHKPFLIVDNHVDYEVMNEFLHFW